MVKTIDTMAELLDGWMSQQMRANQRRQAWIQTLETCCLSDECIVTTSTNVLGLQSLSQSNELYGLIFPRSNKFVLYSKDYAPRAKALIDFYYMLTGEHTILKLYN